MRSFVHLSAKRHHTHVAWKPFETQVQLFHDMGGAIIKGIEIIKARQGNANSRQDSGKV